MLAQRNSSGVKLKNERTPGMIKSQVRELRALLSQPIAPDQTQQTRALDAHSCQGRDFAACKSPWSRYPILCREAAQRLAESPAGLRMESCRDGSNELIRRTYVRLAKQRV